MLSKWIFSSCTIVEDKLDIAFTKKREKKFSLFFIELMQKEWEKEGSTLLLYLPFLDLILCFFVKAIFISKNCLVYFEKRYISQTFWAGLKNNLSSHRRLNWIFFHFKPSWYNYLSKYFFCDFSRSADQLGCNRRVTSFILSKAPFQ